MINILKIQPEALWWKILSTFIGIAGMIVTASILYRIFHFAMGVKPVRDLIRFTSLTTLPFWKRYKMPGQKNKEQQQDNS